MASRKPVMRFNGNKFREYVKGTPRNYSMIVMFTALSSSRQCMICKEAYDEYTVVANSFRYSPAFAQVGYVSFFLHVVTKKTADSLPAFPEFGHNSPSLYSLSLFPCV